MVAYACQLVRVGSIGRLHTIRVSSEPSHPCPGDPPAPVPQGFDYDLWVGPAPFVPYSPRRVRTPWWYWIADYTIGFVAGQGVHFTDVAQWGNDSDDTGPIEVEGRGVIPTGGLCDTATQWHVEMEFANGVRMIYDDHRVSPMGVIFEGTEGKVHVTVMGIKAEPASLMRSGLKRSTLLQLHHGRAHIPDFIHCVKTREETAAPVEAAHRATSLCHLAHIAILTGRKLEWDPARERFLNDDDGNRYLSKAMRGPWHL
jgi:predicted dehydrogenase